MPGRWPTANLFKPVAVLATAHSAAGLQVGANSLASSFMELDKLAVARLQYRLNLLLRLLRYRYETIKVLVHEQAHEQLQQ